MLSRWVRQYGHVTEPIRQFKFRGGFVDWDPRNVTAALEKLNLDTATVEDVSAIIGNDSWCRLTCDQCKQDVKAVITLGEPADGYESRTVQLCHDCVSTAMNEFNKYSDAHF